ncbi:phospholipid carrier-dependent glycosyltransferase [Leucobacter sp. USHLN153]|uniref:phospholipid carrier-dependent glycosyltransferase n=1 Tax=Leucobacter sp. USHLN153 TaxID=3081268 RepID=UPI00301B5DB0
MRTRWLRGLAPVLVLAVAAVLRFWALDRPSTLVFDELYYVRDAISQLAHGFPTTWPDDDPDMSGARATAFSDDPSNAVHPPLGKWLIGLGILAFGPGNGWGWRSAVALAGVLTVAVTMRLTWRMSRNLLVACTAGLLLAIDGVHVTLTRVGLLDGFLTLAVTVGALFVWRDIEQTADRASAQTSDPYALPSPLTEVPGQALAPRIEWRRPWLLAAAVAFGAAAAIKWSGLYPLAAFLLFITVRDLVLRLRASPARGIAEPRPGSELRAVWRATGRAMVQGLVTAAIALPVAFVTYLASWIGWILHPGGWSRTEGAPWFESLAVYHADMLRWHSTLSAEHPYAAHPLTWPLALRPTGMYEVHWDASEGCPWRACAAEVASIPNPLITWAGVLAIIALACVVVFRLRRGPSPIGTVSAFIVVGYLSGWLPWVLTFSRSAVFQFYAVVLTPFSAMALAIALALLCRIPLRPRLASVVQHGSGHNETARARQSSRDPENVASAPFVPDAVALQVVSPEAVTTNTTDVPESVAGTRIAVALFLAFAVALSLVYFPLWSGMPVAEWFWSAHLWLPGWK